ncbi:MAG: DEAD/DEAH box helicase [Nitrososphaerota archaeon]|nr:DEAD/DEAH box helicase [Nitrososphaerota archaeon]
MSVIDTARSPYVIEAEGLMDRLSDIRLETKPHFRILPAVFEEGVPRTWEIESKNEVGYILEDTSASNSVYTTSIDFKVRVGFDDYVQVNLNIVKEAGSASLETDFALESEAGQADKHPNRDALLHIPVTMGKEARELVIRVVKDIKESANGRRVIFKMANLTTSDRLRDDQGSFEFGHLLDFQVKERANGVLQTRLDEVKGYGLLPILGEEGGDSVRFRDYLISEVRVPAVRSSGKGIDQIGRSIETETGATLHPEMLAYLRTQFEGRGWTLYGFQERAIKEIMHQLRASRSPVVVTARTAAGKTEAFLFPVINEILRIKDENKPGVKALFFYPTKALATDQLQRILEVLYWLNKGRKDPITIGVYHGDIEENIALGIPMALRCVLHDESLESGSLRSGQVRLVYDRGRRSLACKMCGEAYPFLLLDRYSVNLSLPDILICTPDVVNWILLNDPKRHALFGKVGSVRACESCGRIAEDSEKVCSKCQSPTRAVDLRPAITPQMVILDELHLFQSIFGGNVSLLLGRLEAAVKRYSTNSSISPESMQYVATSATIKNPKSFGREFFGEEVAAVEATEEEYDYSGGVSKAVVFASPRAYRMIDTAGYSIIEALESTELRMLTFVKTLPMCDMVLNNVRFRVSAEPAMAPLLDQLDGHNSNLTKQQRADIEEKFNEGQIRVLVATSTLEVGVDFKDLDGLILYGAPFNFNNYLQRMGRAGRNNDALILNLLNPVDPIDLFYFRNSIRISRDPTKFIEYPPFPEDNPVIMSKQTVASVYDSANVLGLDVDSIIKQFQAGSPDARVVEYLKELWGDAGPSLAASLIKAETIGLVPPGSPIADALQDKLHLSDLRKVEDSVEVLFDGGGGQGARNPRYDAGGRGRPSKDYQYRRAGLSRSDVELLRQIKGERDA